MHIILTGATGLVGSGVLDAMLRTKDITKISILTRNPVPFAEKAADPRVKVIMHSDFEKYDPSVLDQLRGASGCVWALGISQTKVTADQYVKITKDYALAAARAFSTVEPAEDGKKPFRFIYVSGEGATHRPGRFTPIFGRVKGETEKLLADMTKELEGKLQADVVRPCGVDPSDHEEIKPYIPGHETKSFGVRMAETLGMPVIKTALPGYHTPTRMMGNGMTQMAMGRLDDKLEGPGVARLGPSWIVSNTGLRRLMGL